MDDSRLDSKTVLTLDEIKVESQHIFRKTPFVRVAYLFGSYARQEATPKSDLDFEIGIDEEIGLEFYGLYEFLEDTFHKKVDILTSKEVEMLPCQNIEKERLLLYER